MEITISILLWLLWPFALSFLIFLVYSYLISPLISSEVRKVEPQADWLTTEGILDADVRLEKKRWYLSRNLLFDSFYLEIPSHYADIRVTYLVNGKSYIVRPPMSFSDEAGNILRYKATEMVTKYQPGKRVTVRYDPKNPYHAVIITEVE